MEKENAQSKENVVRRFAEIERDESLTPELKRHRKDIMMLETFLEIRDLLKDMNK